MKKYIEPTIRINCFQYENVLTEPSAVTNVDTYMSEQQAKGSIQHTLKTNSTKVHQLLNFSE